MKKSMRFELLKVAAAFNNAQNNNTLVPFYSANKNLNGFRYLGRNIDPYAAFSPTLFAQIEEIDSDELTDEIYKHAQERQFPNLDECACYELTDHNGNIAQVVIEQGFLPNSHELCDFIIGHAENQSLCKEEITEGRNGYPLNVHACITGFDTYADAESFADTYGLELKTIRRRDGNDLWESCNDYGPLKTEDYLDDRYFVSHSYAGLLWDIEEQLNEYTDMVEDDPSLKDTIDKLNILHDNVEKMQETTDLADDQIIYYDSNDLTAAPIIAKAEVTSIHDDDVHTYAIAAVPLI